MTKYKNSKIIRIQKRFKDQSMGIQKKNEYHRLLLCKDKTKFSGIKFKLIKIQAKNET